MTVVASLGALPAAVSGQGDASEPTAQASDASEPTAQAARNCRLTRYEQRHLGATYVYPVRARVTRCRDAKRIVRGYHACRRRHGGRDGRCRGVFNYRCEERRFAKSRLSYDANARCKKGGGREVYHHYQQNL